MAQGIHVGMGPAVVLHPIGVIGEHPGTLAGQQHGMFKGEGIVHGFFLLDVPGQGNRNAFPDQLGGLGALGRGNEVQGSQFVRVSQRPQLDSSCIQRSISALVRRWLP